MKIEDVNDLEEKRDDVAQEVYRRSYFECCWRQKIAVDARVLAQEENKVSTNG